MLEDDNLHYSLNKILSYNKTFNFIISAREAGKSTAIWRQVYRKFKNTGRPSLVIRRAQVDITDVYIQSIEDTINDWFDVEVEFDVRKDKGCAIVFIGDQEFCVILALSNPLSRIKSLVLKNLAYIVFDEFICNTRLGEKYLKNEAFKFKEVFNTFYRCCRENDLKVLFAGNPYSLYNPYFDDLKVDTTKLKPGALIVENAYAIEAYQLTDGLKKKILSKNPLYQFDDSYTKYAFDGSAINDLNIPISKIKPDYFQLLYCFIYEGKTLGVYKYNGSLPPVGGSKSFVYWIGQVTDEGERRQVFCFDFSDLVSGSVIISVADKKMFQSLKLYIGKRRVIFQDLATNYAIEDIFSQLGGR